ncbi:Type I restriction-modification system methyltransferase subunit [Comamonas aquatica]|uniref:N-6 DNA methylase n=1 Tax=Comamonas aquatica TaxID=225991 RepID=UPI001EF26652|nr:N-6 DNA methylase [Comamonas aquatica]CAB5678047.1 Type I restriction-modification system methyltransferase subunit [Comamonas aquatica]CAC9213241.1 Type I restriction-modification system methyltransferase subunit [Comamonas aquatica]
MFLASNNKVSNFDTDRYYTPPKIANRAFEYAKLDGNPIICADTACGAGNLLMAAQEVLQAKYCIGIDNDSSTIRKLRQEKPEWRLYIADLLKRHRAPPTEFPDAQKEVDLLVLNPPFSLGHRKNVSVRYQGTYVKCSVAMAHILRSLELFKPTHGAIAVVPESLLYSNTDENARDLLENKFTISELTQLNISTFQGARVHSSFIQLVSPGRKPTLSESKQWQSDHIFTNMVRGGMQMHAFDRVASGIKVIHTTSLKHIANGGLSTIQDFTSATSKGLVSGWLILLPRVGIPKKELLFSFYYKENIQLSDCVIGLKFSSKKASLNAKDRILKNWDGLVSQYRGTAARYTTIPRLNDWLHSIGIIDISASEEF